MDIVVQSDRPMSGHVGTLTITPDSGTPDRFALHWRGEPDDGPGDDHDTEVHVYHPSAYPIAVVLSCGGECRVGTPSALTYAP